MRNKLVYTAIADASMGGNAGSEDIWKYTCFSQQKTAGKYSY
jgi:hypothetical protein